MSLRRRAVPLEEQIALDRLLDDAFAPARSRSVPISAARVRARVAWEREAPVSPRWRAALLLGRLGETSLALGMTAILFVGSLGAIGEGTGPVRPERGGEHVIRITALLDESRLLRLLRLGRAVAVIDDFDPATALAPRAEAGGLLRTIRERERPPGAAPRRPADEGDPVTTLGDRLGILR